MDVLVNNSEMADSPIMTAPPMQRTPSEEELAIAIAMSLGTLEEDEFDVVDVGKLGAERGEVEQTEGAEDKEDEIPQKEDSSSEDDLADKIISEIGPRPTFPSLDELGLEVKHVLNDGNCEFEAIRDQLGALGYEISDHSYLRFLFGDTIQQMKDNPELNPHFKEVLEALSTHDLTEIFFEGRWANNVADLFPQVSANMFRCAIHIYDPEGNFMREVRPEGVEGDIEDIARVIYNGHHYDSTRIKGSRRQRVVLQMCSCGKCGTNLNAAQRMATVNTNGSGVRQSQFTDLKKTFRHIQKVQRAEFLEVKEEFRILDRTSGKEITVPLGAILEVLDVDASGIRVQSVAFDAPQVISLFHFCNLEPHATEEMKADKKKRDMQLLNSVMQALGGMSDVRALGGSASCDFEVGDRVRATMDFQVSLHDIYEGDVFTVQTLTSDRIVLSNGSLIPLTMRLTNSLLQYFTKVVDLNDVEQTVQAKAYIVQEKFRNFPEGTRLVVSEVMEGKTTVYHRELLDVPLVLTNEELSKCKIESELIDFNSQLNFRGLVGQISEYFEETQVYRVNFEDGSSKNFTHEELEDEISYSRTMKYEDPEDSDLEDKVVEKPKADLIPIPLLQVRLRGTWYTESGDDVFGAVEGTEYFPADSATETGFIHLSAEDQVTLRMSGNERLGFFAEWTIFWEDGEVWHHEANLQTRVQPQSDRMLCDEIADSNEIRVKREIIEQERRMIKHVRQNKMIFGLMGGGALNANSFREDSLEESQKAYEVIHSRFAETESFHKQSRKDLLNIADIVLRFLYGDDSPLVQFAEKTRTYIYISITATLSDWDFVESFVQHERKIMQNRLYLLSENDFVVWDNTLSREVEKFNESVMALTRKTNDIKQNNAAVNLVQQMMQYGMFG